MFSILLPQFSVYLTRIASSLLPGLFLTSLKDSHGKTTHNTKTDQDKAILIITQGNHAE